MRMRSSPDLAHAPGVRYPVLVPNLRGLARAEAAGRRCDRGLHRRDRRVHPANIGMTVAESLAAFAPVLARAGDARLVAARVCLDRLRVPVHRSRRAGARRRGRAPAARARRRRGLLRRHDRGRRAGPGRGTDRAGRGGRHPARAHRVPLPRHARDGAGERRGRARRGRPLLRLVRRRDGRLPVRARAPPATSRPRTSSTSSMPRAGPPGCRWRAWSRGSSPAARPLATKVGQAGGSSPRPSAVRSRRRSAGRKRLEIPLSNAFQARTRRGDAHRPRSCVRTSDHTRRNTRLCRRRRRAGVTFSRATGDPRSPIPDPPGAPGPRTAPPPNPRSTTTNHRGGMEEERGGTKGPDRRNGRGGAGG